MILMLYDKKKSTTYGAEKVYTSITGRTDNPTKLQYDLRMKEFVSLPKKFKILSKVHCESAERVPQISTQQVNFR